MSTDPCLPVLLNSQHKHEREKREKWSGKKVRDRPEGDTETDISPRTLQAWRRFVGKFGLVESFALKHHPDVLPAGPEDVCCTSVQRPTGAEVLENRSGLGRVTPVDHHVLSTCVHRRSGHKDTDKTGRSAGRDSQPLPHPSQEVHLQGRRPRPVSRVGGGGRF